MDYLKLAKQHMDKTAALRRHFHENPEYGPAEQAETMAFVRKQLEAMDIPYTQVPGGGILGWIRGDPQGKTVLLRTEMDALPIQENTQNLQGKKVCVSKIPGAMHGCGHDGHMAMVLTAASLLKDMEEELPGNVLLFFEEGEEGHGNIETLLRYMDQAHIHADTCYGTHVRWDIPSKKLACCPGTCMSGLRHFRLTLHGQGGHGSRPDLAHSVVDCFTAIYAQMQTIRLLHVPPDSGLTWSVCSLHAGSTFNVIPDTLTCEGSIRLMDRLAVVPFWREMKHAITALCDVYSCTYQLEMLENLYPVVNDTDARNLFLDAAAAHVGTDALMEVKPWMGSDTYNSICNMIPGVYVFLGIRNDEYGSGANHHTPEFDLDEAALPYGVAAALSYVVEYLKRPPVHAGFQPVAESFAAMYQAMARED